MRTNGQERAEFALEKINKHKIDKELKSLTAGAPTVILQNGFGQAMAFWLSKTKTKGGDKYKFVFNSIKEWLTKKNFIAPIASYNSGDDDESSKAFIKKLSEIDQSKYLCAQREALQLLEWIKRYAAAFCEDEDEQANNDEVKP